MKTSGMIKKLQESLEENGDVEVKLFNQTWLSFYDAEEVYFAMTNL